MAENPVKKNSGSKSAAQKPVARRPVAKKPEPTLVPTEQKGKHLPLLRAFVRTFGGVFL